MSLSYSYFPDEEKSSDKSIANDRRRDPGFPPRGGSLGQKPGEVLSLAHDHCWLVMEGSVMEAAPAP